MTEKQMDEIEKRITPILAEYFQCWAFVAYSVDGESLTCHKSKTQMHTDALQEAMRDLLLDRKLPSPVAIVGHDDDGF